MGGQDTLTGSENENSPEANILVTTIGDNTAVDGFCSLREAIQAANTNSAVDACPAGDSILSDTITFSVSGMISLGGAPLDVTGGGPLVIDGGGITLSGGNSVRAFYVGYSANLTLKNLAIMDGYAWEGGGIHNSGVLTVQDSTISGCNTDGNLTGGGGIYNNGTLTVVNSTLSGNHALSSGSDASYGGGIFNFTGTVSLIHSTLSANEADYGGGILSFSPLRVTNSTLSGNHAAQEGGGIYSKGGLYLHNATVVNNGAGDFGGGVYTAEYLLSLRNTIVVDNTASGGGPDCYVNTVTTYGYNLIGNTAGCGIYPKTGDLTDVSPKLGPLQDNGGPTFTHALLPGSLAIDHGNRNGCIDHQGFLINTDQRGLPRSGRCDIGAYEWQPAAAPGPYTVFLPISLRSCSSSRLYFDDFSNPGSGWYVGETNYGRYEYLNGEYRILAKVTPAWEASLPWFKATNYVVTVDVRNATGVNGSYGILFSFAEDWSHFYFFVVQTDGRYVILRADPDTSYWIADGYSGAIHTGTAANQLRLERNGSMIWAYANGELLTILEDGTFTGPGYVGLITVADTNPNVDARFDNFTVEPISCGASNAYPAPAADLEAGNAMEFAPLEKVESQFPTMEIHINDNPLAEGLRP
jgi:CSLREA domain-containing protein